MSRVRIPSPAPKNPRNRHLRPLEVVTSMRHSALLILATSVLCAQSYKMEPAGAPPSDLPPAFASLMSQQGYKVSGPGGVYCEVWFRSSLPSGPKSTEDSVAFPTIPHGA